MSLLPKKYRVRNTRILHGETMAEAGQVVYQCFKCDYGLASDDSRITGIEHASVTLKEDGDYPSFTIPKRDLELIP